MSRLVSALESWTNEKRGIVNWPLIFSQKRETTEKDGIFHKVVKKSKSVAFEEEEEEIIEETEP